MSKSLTAKALTLATLLPLAGCGVFSAPSPPPPPLIQTKVVKELPPQALLDYPPPPEMPAQLQSRDDIRDLALRLAAWGKELAARLDAIKDWSARSAPSPAGP